MILNGITIGMSLNKDSIYRIFIGILLKDPIKYL